MIETRLLRQFIAVAEELHFNRAAQRLHMAQPPLSQAIQRLEAQVGAPLLARTNRSVTLTPAGAAFLETARRMLAALDEGVAQARRVAQGMEGHLTATFVNISPYESLLRGLRRFRAAHPAVSFTLREATTREQVEALELGRADIGLMRHPGVSAPSLHFETLLSEPVLIALPASHRLAECDVVELAALREDAFVASARTLGPAFMTSWCRCAWRRVSRRAWRRKRGGWRRWWRWWPAVSARPCYRPRWRGSRAAMWCSGRSRWKRRTRCGGWICCWPGGLVTPRRYGIR